MIVEDLGVLLSSSPSDLGATEWWRLDQQAVAAFAEATCTPADTVVPPMMLLALTNRFLPELLQVPAASNGINYGANSVHFNAPVRAGDRIRARAFLLAAEEVPGGVQTTVQIRVDIDGSDEPACIVESLSRWLR